MKKISILGSTGSIGTQTLEVCENLGNVQIMGLSVNKNIKLAEEQIRKFKPKLVSVVDENSAKELKVAVSDTDTKIISGRESMSEISTMPEIDTVVTSVVGIAGLEPTMAAIKSVRAANSTTRRNLRSFFRGSSTKIYGCINFSSLICVFLGRTTACEH